ncbi:MAG TPA: UDP-glucose 4-epimerase GalE [Fibrobacteria bacterium]|nr:UDP-glucose 4-epimerase GalE [Fibrobacteria bacterium]
MKITVAGGAGYIGSHVARRLVEAGHEVVVFDNLSTGNRSSVPPGATFVHGDVSDPLATRKVLAGSDALVYLAAWKAAGESMTDPVKYSRNNLQATLSFLDAAQEVGVKFVVFSSSAAVFGEPKYLPIDEDHPKDPTNYYGFTKLEIERVLAWYDRLLGMRSACLRYFNAAGYDPQGRITGLERNPANLIPVVMEAACGVREKVQVFGNDYDTHDGTGVRDYIHVTDLAEAHLMALQYLETQGKSFVVNLGTGKGLSVLDVVNSASKLIGRPVPHQIVGRREGDPAALWASGEKAKELLGWVPRHSDVDTIVSTTWAAYKANGLVK